MRGDDVVDLVQCRREPSMMAAGWVAIRVANVATIWVRARKHAGQHPTCSLCEIFRRRNSEPGWAKRMRSKLIKRLAA